MEPSDLIKSVPEKVLEDAYSDAVSGALKEAGKAGVDLVKTIRLALFPLQFTAMLQDRLARYIERSLKRVPEQNLIAPVESLALQVTDRLRMQDDGSVIGEMYISLLARAMDRSRAGEAHPAFVHIIGQLAPDEALLIEQLSQATPAAYLRTMGSSQPLFADAREKAMQGSNLDDIQKEKLLRIALKPEVLQHYDLIFTYIEHLVSLGLVSYTNEPWIEEFNGSELVGCKFWFVELNGFGKLFHAACLSDIQNNIGNESYVR